MRPGSWQRFRRPLRLERQPSGRAIACPWVEDPPQFPLGGEGWRLRCLTWSDDFNSILGPTWWKESSDSSSDSTSPLPIHNQTNKYKTSFKFWFHFHHLTWVLAGRNIQTVTNAKKQKAHTARLIMKENRLLRHYIFLYIHYMYLFVMRGHFIMLKSPISRKIQPF